MNNDKPTGETKISALTTIETFMIVFRKMKDPIYGENESDVA